MKGAWPFVKTSRGVDVEIYHSLPRLGNSELHSHIVNIRISINQEINPQFGHNGFPLDKTDHCLKKIAALVDRKNLNDLMPFPPTAENLCVWLFVRCPGFIEAVEVDAYDGYRVSVDRSKPMRSEMVAAYRGADSVLELTV